MKPFDDALEFLSLIYLNGCIHTSFAPWLMVMATVLTLCQGPGFIWHHMYLTVCSVTLSDSSLCCRWQTWCGTLSSNLLSIMKPVKPTHFLFQSEIVVRCLVAWDGMWPDSLVNDVKHIMLLLLNASVSSIGIWSWGSLKDLETWTVFPLCLGFPLIWMSLKPSFLCIMGSEGIILSSGLVSR